MGGSEEGEGGREGRKGGMTVIHILIRTRKRSKLRFDSECFALKQQVRDQYTVVKSWDSRAARDNIAFLVKDFQRLKRQKKEQFDVGQEIIAIERIEGETNALWGMWKSSSASGSRLSVCRRSGSHISQHSITHPARYDCHDHSPDRPTHFSTARSPPPTCCGPYPAVPMEKPQVLIAWPMNA